MTTYSPVRRLAVFRRFASGARGCVGHLAQNRRGVFFQYDPEYLRSSPNVSPFALAFDGSLQQAPAEPHEGLHGVFADSLPDGWGRMVMDRVFRRAGVLPGRLTGMDRLSWVGARGMGALAFEPASPFAPESPGDLDVSELGERARALFEDDTAEVLPELAATGSSGGARPKALIYLPAKGGDVGSARPREGLAPWVVKFTSASLPLGHQESLCEAAHLTLA